jgi:methyltransferase (TIGR00027 family)
MPRIQDVTDTARAVAAYRALETERPGGLIRDPFAATLAGEKGMAIAESSPAIEWMSFAVSLRDRLVDETIGGVVGHPDIETVVNFGAGLDSRPWRLNLPSGLRWIEVDFQEMLEYKAKRLRKETPRCQLEQIAANILVASDREPIFRAVGDRPAVMITEGLLMYLSRETLEALATEMAMKSGVRRWILDVVSKEIMQRMLQLQGDMTDEVASLRPKDHLRGKQILDFVVSHGWRPVEARNYARDADDVVRKRFAELAGALEPLPGTLADDDPSGVYLFERSS